MANTTFNGPVRSENGFQTITTAGGTGTQTVTGTFGANTSITGSLTVGTNTSITGSLTVGTNTSITGGLTVGTNTSITGDLTVGTNTSITGGLTVGTNTTVTGTVTARSGSALVAGGAAAFVATNTANSMGIYFGSGAPTISAAKGSLYLRSDGTTTNDRAYINTNGSTTWTALTTAA